MSREATSDGAACESPSTASSGSNYSSSWTTTTMATGEEEEEGRRRDHSASTATEGLDDSQTEYSSSEWTSGSSYYSSSVQSVLNTNMTQHEESDKEEKQHEESEKEEKTQQTSSLPAISCQSASATGAVSPTEQAERTEEAKSTVSPTQASATTASSVTGRLTTAAVVESRRRPPPHPLTTELRRTDSVLSARLIDFGDWRKRLYVRKEGTKEALAVGGPAGRPRPLSERRLLVVMRHGERLDRVSPDWLRNCWAGDDYHARDLNQPFALPIRDRPKCHYANDPPLSVIGSLSCQLLGRAFRVRKLAPTTLYCSPALRCVESAFLFHRAAAVGRLRIRIEPGLFDWGAWYDSPPELLWPNELAASCSEWPIDLDYRPYMTLKELQRRLSGPERQTDFRLRIRETLAHITAALDEKKDGADRLLIVGHASTMDACLQLTRTAGAWTADDWPSTGIHDSDNDEETSRLDTLARRFPCCAQLAFSDDAFSDRQRWTLLPAGQLPPLTTLDFTNRVELDLHPLTCSS